MMTMRARLIEPVEQTEPLPFIAWKGPKKPVFRRPTPIPAAALSQAQIAINDSDSGWGGVALCDPSLVNSYEKSERYRFGSPPSGVMEMDRMTFAVAVVDDGRVVLEGELAGKPEGVIPIRGATAVIFSGTGLPPSGFLQESPYDSPSEFVESLETMSTQEAFPHDPLPGSILALQEAHVALDAIRLEINEVIETAGPDLSAEEVVWLRVVREALADLLGDIDEALATGVEPVTLRGALRGVGQLRRGLEANPVTAMIATQISIEVTKVVENL